MDKNTIDEKLNLIAKKSRNILYSTKVFEKTDENIDESIEENIDEKTNENIKKPKIILRELKKEENGKENHYWAIILKYKVSEDIPQEVIIGTVKLEKNSELKGNTVEIIKLIIKQLEENGNKGLGYNSYESLCEYVNINNIPFNLTMEGQDILASKSQEIKKIPRTCFENNQGKIENLFSEEDLEKMKKERKNELEVYMNKIREKKKWNDRREKILNSLHKDGKDKSFLKGEKITKFIQDADKDESAQRDMVADYLLGVFEEEKNDDNPMLNLAKGYVKLKEKGIAIDANIKLEELENNYYTSIKEKNGEVSLDEYKNIEIIEDYENFFDLVKKGRDWNARCFALKLKKLDFEFLKTLIKAIDSKNIDEKDDELLKYIDLKEKMIKELKTESIDVEYSKNSISEEMYNFLLHSSIRKNTRVDDERVISVVYQHARRGILENYANEIELYNHYAEKNNIPVCKLPKERNTSEKEPVKSILNVIKKIDNEIIGKEENSEEKSVQDETKKESEEQR